MGELTLEKMVEGLQKECGANLLSVILYGSAAAGDHTGKKSDYNLLVLTESLEVPDLLALSQVSVKWVKQGNPPPLLFTAGRFKTSLDVFPIEIGDIKENHQVLFGTDYLKDIEVRDENLRLELEHELKGKLIHLRERFLLTEGKPKLVAELMIGTLSTFLVLFKNALRLYSTKPPVKKMDALSMLKEHIPCDTDIFQTVERMKSGESIKGLDMIECFNRYLRTVESVVDGIDHFIQQKQA